MRKRKINAALSILHDTTALVSNSCWIVASMEDPSSIEDLEAIQEEMIDIKGKFLQACGNVS